MSEKSDQLRTELMDDERDVEIEKVVQLSRIADALESIEETGVYTWPQWESDVVESKLGEPQGRRRE